MINVEKLSTLTMPDGSQRTITIRIHDLRQDSDDLWSVAVDVLGFETDDHTRAYGVDWLNAITGATLFIRGLAGGQVQDLGATIVPHIVPPERDDPSAQAISEGINCLGNLRKLAKADSQPPPEFMPELNAMKRSLEAVRDGTVVASFVVDNNLLDAVRAVRTLVSDWLVTGQASPDVIPQIEGLLRRMGIEVDALDALDSSS